MNRGGGKVLAWHVGFSFLFLAFGGWSGLALYLGVVILTELAIREYSKSRT